MSRMRSKKVKTAIWIAVASASVTFLAVWIHRCRAAHQEDDTDYYGQYR